MVLRGVANCGNRRGNGRMVLAAYEGIVFGTHSPPVGCDPDRVPLFHPAESYSRSKKPKTVEIINTKCAPPGFVGYSRNILSNVNYGEMNDC